MGVGREGGLKMMELKLRKAGSVSGDLCEWNPGNGKWYWVHRSNMEVEGDLKLQSNLFNALLSGLVAVVQGSYDKTNKKLKLKL
jgi:hypothetical protein